MPVMLPESVAVLAVMVPELVPLPELVLALVKVLAVMVPEELVPVLAVVMVPELVPELVLAALVRRRLRLCCSRRWAA